MFFSYGIITKSIHFFKETSDICYNSFNYISGSKKTISSKEIIEKKVKVITAQQFINDNTMEEKTECDCIKEACRYKERDKDGLLLYQLSDFTCLKCGMLHTFKYGDNESVSYYGYSKKEEKKIIGYKIKPECTKYSNAITEIVQYEIKSGTYRLDTGCLTSSAEKTLKEAGVLDLWFEPVYEEKKREPLFTTEDGKPIYEGNEYWGVRSDPWHTKSFRAHVNEGYFGLWQFSTESAAKQYIHDNEKVFSRKEILDSIFLLGVGGNDYFLIDKSKLGL